MSNDDKVITVPSELVVKKSPDFKKIKHKAKAGLSEAEAIERHTVGRYGDDEREEEDGDE